MMKNSRILVLLFLSVLAASVAPAQAQVYSPRRLTQRIAPLVPPTPAPASVPQGARPAPAVPVARSAAPMRPIAPTRVQITQPEAEEGGNQVNSTEDPASKPAPSPVRIDSQKVQPDPAQSLQFIDLSITNICEKPVAGLTMRLVYFDAGGRKLKTWTTRRELDRPLAGHSAMELSQPAYFMPLVARQVRVEVETARFADGSEWQAGTIRPAQ